MNLHKAYCPPPPSPCTCGAESPADDHACIACGCTERTPCVDDFGPCAWSAVNPDLCTGCVLSIGPHDVLFAENDAARTCSRCGEPIEGSVLRVCPREMEDFADAPAGAYRYHRGCQGVAEDDTDVESEWVQG